MVSSKGKTLFATRIKEGSIPTIDLVSDGKTQTVGLVLRENVAEGEFSEADFLNVSKDGKLAYIWSTEKPSPIPME